MHLTILTPEKKYFDGEATLVQVPGSEEQGPFTLLENHAAIVSALRAGKVRVQSPDGEHNYLIKSGFLEASDNQVSLLVEGIEEA